MQLTTNEGLPYPLPSDYAAVPAHMQALAKSIDGKVSGWDAAFQAVSKQPTFLLRLGVDAASTTAGLSRFVSFDTVIFNNTTGAMSNGGWQQASNDVAGWWLVGAYVFATNGGTVTVGAINKLWLHANYAGLGTTFSPGPAPSTIIQPNPPVPAGAVYGESTEGNNGGEPVQAVGIMKLFSSAFVALTYSFTDPGAAATRTVKAGSALWGTRLGNV